MRLPKGKVPKETLEKIVFKNLGVKNPRVILGPQAGEDGALIEIGDKVLVTSMDPVTGALKRIGWLAVNISANDVATFGAQPLFFSSCILLPENVTEELLQEICGQIHKASKRLNIAVIGGHSEVTPDLEHPIIVGCSMGITTKEHFVTSGGANPKDFLILTKGAGIEGTAILATDRYKLLRKKAGLNESLLRKAENFFENISVVKEAMLVSKIGGVTAMHDPTEGGVFGGIHEMADASNVGVKIFENKIFVATETRKICSFFGINPLQLISSGALLISVKPKFAEKTIKALKADGIKASIIGEFLTSPEERVLISSNGSKSELPRPFSDHLWIALEK